MYIYLIIIIAVVTRFFPHMPNFVPITALAIFSAANMDWKKSVGLTLSVRFISDLFLGFFAWQLMLAVYTSHLVGVLFGFWIKNSSNHKILKIVASSLGSSAVFFLVTNFAFLYSEYQHNLNGIILAYTNGLPFLKGTLTGDLCYTVALFGVYVLVTNLVKIKQRPKLNLNYGN